MKKCYECETTEDLHEHHVVPKSRGGTKTVTLCYQCHMKVHGRDGKGLNHSKLVKEGIAAAKARGVKLGNPQWEQAVPKAAEARKAQGEATVKKYGDWIVSLRDSGLSFMNIKHRLNDMGVPTPTGKRKMWTKGSVFAIYKRYKKMEEK